MIRRCDLAPILAAQSATAQDRSIADVASEPGGPRRRTVAAAGRLSLHDHEVAETGVCGG